MTLRFQLEKSNSLKLFNKSWWPKTRDEWAPILLESNYPFWKAQSTAEGVPWSPLSPSYQKRKERLYRGMPILVVSGQMFQSAKVVGIGGKLMVQSTDFGKFHQFGTKRMVARPWMGVPETAMDKLPGIAWKHILRPIKNAS